MTIKTTLKLPATFTDNTLPKDRLDPVLPDAGALALVDFMHPALAAPIVGVPANGVTIENLAKAQALAALGTAVDTFTVVSSGAGFDGVAARIERTTKGGLHVATKQGTSGYDPGALQWYLPIPANLITYLYNNTDAAPGGSGHKLYLSIWGRYTRVRLTGITNANDSAYQYVGDSPATTNFLFFGGGNSFGPLGGDGQRLPNPDAVGAFLGNQATKSNWFGAKPATSPTANGNERFMTLGPGSDLYGYTADIRRASPSKVYYRFYLEDLTISGRTYAQVDALDLQQYTKDVLTAGGRYFGDTWTDPNTLG